MAFLFDAGTEGYLPLAAHHTFGRLASMVNTHLDKPYISKLHATIEWCEQRWFLKNLGLNGTLINGEMLQQGDTRPLELGDRIQLAESNDPEFRVVDLSPPTDILWPLECDHVPQPIALSRYHLLPNEQAPELALFLQDQQWHQELLIVQGDQETHPLQAGDVVQFSNSHWKLIREQIYSPTEVRVKPSEKISKFEFVFNLSLDEESTQLHLQHEQHKLDLGVRNHHYLLLLLARHRAEDMARGLDSGSQGWVYTDQLAAELGMDSTHMNTQIFRLRKQLVDGLPHVQEQSCVLERRSGKLRFGCEKFKIYKGGNIISQTPCTSLAIHPELSS